MAMSDGTLLSVEVRQKAFDGRTVLENMRFDLGAREIVALVGPSGCGKTSLLRMIGGLDSDFEGAIQWRSNHPPRIGTVFQEPRLLPWRTVRQNLVLTAGAEQTPVIDRLLHDLGLWAFRDHYPRRISLGMARRAAIARAFAVEPDLLLLDEPFVSLDPDMAARSRDALLEAWHASPVAAILVTHDRTEAALLADRILLLSSAPMRVVSEVAVPPGLRGGTWDEGARFAAGALAT